MARTFNATTQYFRATGAGATAYPLSMHCLYKPAASPALEDEDTVMCLSNASNLNQFFIGYYNRTTTGLLVRAMAQSDGAANYRFPHKDGTLTTGTWYSLTAVYTNATTIQIYVNGVAGGSDITAGTGAPSPTGITDTAIGVVPYNAGSLYGYANGSIAEAAIWNVALTADEVAALGARYSPLLVRPQSLVGYWPLLARATDEEDWVGGLTLTNTNTATAAEHPYMIYPYANRQAIVVQESRLQIVNGGLLNRGIYGGRLVA